MFWVVVLPPGGQSKPSLSNARLLAARQLFVVTWYIGARAHCHMHSGGYLMGLTWFGELWPGAPCHVPAHRNSWPLALALCVPT